MAVFFLFLRNVLLPIEILKIKILEHSDPPSQHFFVHKAFSHFFFLSREGYAVSSGRMAQKYVLFVWKVDLYAVVGLFVFFMS